MTRRDGRRGALGTYRAKRDFSATPEPRGRREERGKGRRGGREVSREGDRDGGESGTRFVVQRHRARRLHYDVRLEVDGALVSWAVPKGPTLDPEARRAAFHVEDHPVEYLDFEGVIPGGQYGAGDVIVWDRGTWDAVGTAGGAAAVAGGELHFDLYGEKLRGRFLLVRTTTEPDGRERWLLRHKHDEAAEAGWDAEAHPRSVKSGRTNEEIAGAPASIWRSDLPADEAEVPVVRSRGRSRPGAGRAAGSPGRRRRSHRPPPGWDGPSKAELDALEALGSGGRWELQGKEVALTNLDKVLLPARPHEAAVTKRNLVRYYVSVAPAILPYLAGRPVNMHRFPDGAGQPGFWHKQAPAHAPHWLTRWHDPGAGPGTSGVHVVVDSAPALAWVANYAALELHPWTGRLPEVDRPTWAYIDIDPGARTSFEEVLVLARLFRTGLDHLGVVAMPKLTGSRGLHIWIPIEPRYTFHQTSEWVEKISRAVGSTVPDLVSWTWHKSDRRGLARLDYTQNASNKTLVAPYSVRARAGAPVSAPIAWDELDDPGLGSDRVTVRALPDRLARIGDLFEPLLEGAQPLPAL